MKYKLQIVSLGVKGLGFANRAFTLRLEGGLGSRLECLDVQACFQTRMFCVFLFAATVVLQIHKFRLANKPCSIALLCTGGNLLTTILLGTVMCID